MEGPSLRVSRLPTAATKRKFHNRVSGRWGDSNHRRITWLFAVSHAIDELRHAPWSSYLVSARTIEMPLFSAAETRLLLTDPLANSPLFRDDEARRPRFAADLWGDGGIELIHAEAGGWPHLVQLLAETTVAARANGGGASGAPPRRPVAAARRGGGIPARNPNRRAGGIRPAPMKPANGACASP
jgi:hypothetical protein